ncbi:MAG: hypothetical protein QM606_07305, partial [Leucobacter sp.]
LAPISNISVSEEAVEQNEYDAVVTATFDLGDRTVTRDFRTYDSYSSGWSVSDGLLRISVTNFKGLGLTVNGVEPGDEYAAVFPGAYRFELGVDEFEVGGGEDVHVLATDDDTSALYEVGPVLTEQATQTFRDLVRASLEECLAMNTLSTPCGMDISQQFSDGSMAVDGTVKRTLSAEGEAALNSLKPEPSYDQPTVVSSSDYIQVDIESDFTKDGATGHGSVLMGGSLNTPKVDFANEKPEVVWE